LRTIGGWILLVLGILGPCLQWYDQKAHYMAMPTVYKQLSWFAFGGVFALIGAWLTFRLKPWWLYLGILILLIGSYIWFWKYDEAIMRAEYLQFMIRNVS